MNKREGLLYWIGIAGFSLLLFWGSINLLRTAPPAESSLAYPTGNYYRSYTKYTKGGAISVLKNGLEGGVPVIIGSSELAEKFPYQPYKYFPEKFGLSVNAFGDQGFQIMTIIAALQMVKKEQAYENGRITILISPQWFIDGKGTHPEIMNNKLFSPENLAHLCFNPELGEASRKVLLDYASSWKELRIPSFVLSLCDTHPASQKIIWLANEIVQASRQLQFLVNPELSETQKTGISPTADKRWSSSPQWSAEKEKAAEFHNDNCHNAFDTYDEYFIKYLKPEIDKGRLPLKIPPPPPMATNIEYLHFLQLLHELRDFKRKPLFVLLPLNPKIYGNIAILDPIMHQVAVDLKDEGFGVLDLWSIPYKNGRLHSQGHPGALGWVEIGEGLTKHFEL